MDFFQTVKGQNVADAIIALASIAESNQNKKQVLVEVKKYYYDNDFDFSGVTELLENGGRVVSMSQAGKNSIVFTMEVNK